MTSSPKELQEKYGIKEFSYDEEDFVKLKATLEPLFQEDEEKKQSDAAIKRFLRIFGNPENAHAAILKYLEWRDKYEVDTLTEKDPIIIKEHSLQRCLFGDEKDACGRPVCLVQVQHHDKNKKDIKDLTRYLTYVLEKLASQCDEDVIDNTCVIFDFKGFSYANMDYDFVKRLMWLLHYCYPDRLGICLLVNTPWIFYGCWAIIKYWLNEVIVSKIIFIDSEQELAEFINVTSLPKQLFD